MNLQLSLEAHFDGEHDRLEIVLRVLNAGDVEASLHFPSAQQVEVWARDSTGAELWRWSRGRRFGQAATRRSLAAGEAFEVRLQWPHPALGECQLEARLLATSGLSVQVTTRLTVP